ncbi:MAG: SpoIIE family protein phosphatase, partial [Bacteroidota bacterium]
SFERLPFVDVGEIQITEPSMLLIYTDGLSDLQNPSGDYFDDDLVKAFVEQNHHMSSTAFNDYLLEHLDEFVAGGVFPDDFTVLTTKIVPVENPC